MTELNHGAVRPDGASRLAVFRADGDATAGFGHVARCAAVAEHLSALGWDCRLATSSEAAWPEGISGFSSTLRLDAKTGRDALGFQKMSPGCDLLVVDHYGLDAEFEQACRPWARRILAIDDLADRRHDADMLVDSAAPERTDDYRGLVPAHCEMMCGPDHAPLRAEFFERRLANASREMEVVPKRALVSLGGGPVIDLAVSAARTILEQQPDIDVDLVLPPSAPDVGLKGARVSIHPGNRNLAALMSQASFAVGACGVAALERCALGLPSVAVQTVSNQRHIAETLTRFDAAIVVKPDENEIRRAIGDIFANFNLRGALAVAASRLCDGLGAARLAAVLDAEPRARDGKAVRLRPVYRSDAPTILDWQRDPRTRQFAHNASVPSAEEHGGWIDSKLDDRGVILMMILHGGVPAGVLRLDVVRERMEAWLISIYIAPDRYRLGLAACALALAHRLRPRARFVAEVLPGNEPSHRLFRAAGYVWRDERYERASLAERATSETAA